MPIEYTKEFSEKFLDFSQGTSNLIFVGFGHREYDINNIFQFRLELDSFPFINDTGIVFSANLFSSNFGDMMDKSTTSKVGNSYHSH